MLTTIEIQQTLATLGYYDGAIGTSVNDANFKDDLKRFQKDYGLVADGIYGPKTDGVLAPIHAKIDQARNSGALPDSFSMRRWRCTNYYIGEQASWNPNDYSKVPMVTPKGSLITNIEWRAFSEAALEGTTKLTDGRLVNVAGTAGSTTNPSYRPCDSTVFQPVFNFALKNGWIPDKAGYAGILTDGNKATNSKCFAQIVGGINGYPIYHNIESLPWRTLAADTGTLSKHDPKYKGLGGVCSIGTKVFILEYYGVKLPDGNTHDGWFTVNDTGAGIYGAHYDVFIGYRRNNALVATPPLAHVWYSGIEAKLSMNYSYGL